MQIEVGLGVGVEYPSYALSSSNRDCALLRDNLVTIRNLHDTPSTSFNEFEVSCTALAHPIGLGWGVYLKRESQV